MRKFERIALLFTMIVTALAFTWGDTLTESLQDISLFGEQSITPATPVTGQNKLYFKTDGQLYVLDDTGSESLAGGSGAGGSRLNLIIDPSFEKDVSEGVCTTCTASQETTACLLTDTNAACLKMAFSASVGDYQDVAATTDSLTPFDAITVSGTGIYDGNYTLASRPGSLLNTNAITAGTTRRFNIFHLDAGGGTWYAIIAYDALVSDAQNTVKYVITSDTSDFNGFSNGGSYPTLVDLGVIGSSSQATSATQYGVFDSPSVASTDKLNYISEYTGVVGLASARIKTDQEGVEFCSIVDGAESACTAVRSDGIWDVYTINSTMSLISFGYKIKATSSITGNVYVDEVYAGSNPIEIATQPVYIATDGGSTKLNINNIAAGPQSLALTGLTTSITTNASSNPVEINFSGILQGYFVGSAPCGGTVNAVIEVFRDGTFVSNVIAAASGATSPVVNILSVAAQAANIYDFGTTVNTTHEYTFTLQKSTNSNCTVLAAEVSFESGTGVAGGKTPTTNVGVILKQH